MSKTLFVEFRGAGFWAFDVVSKIFAKHLVDVATVQNHPVADWLSCAVERWRENAVISDFGFYLDEEWSESQLNIVSQCICGACDLIGQRDSIPADEIESWEILDDLRIFARGLAVVRTRPVVEFGNGLIALLGSSLPAPPPGTWWFYGIDDSPSTIKKRS